LEVVQNVTQNVRCRSCIYHSKSLKEIQSFK
jgi:hypothetical protein